MSIKIEQFRCSTEQSESIVLKVISKSTVNKFRKGEGKLFSMDVKDETGTSRMVFFNQFADKFFYFLQVSF